MCVEPTTSRGHITPPTASSHARSKEKNALGSTSRKGSYGLPYLLTYYIQELSPSPSGQVGVRTTVAGVRYGCACSTYLLSIL